jgi:nucleotidyltransferase substrate binding protein (TIGR01987 family)
VSQQTPGQLKEMRVKQRLENLNGAISFLREALATTASPRIKHGATIKAFELTFELCWKCLKDYLEYSGISEVSPRAVLKAGFRAELLRDGQAWIDLLDRRNRLVHVYNEAQAAEAALYIERTALPHLDQLIASLNNLKFE